MAATSINGMDLLEPLRDPHRSHARDLAPQSGTDMGLPVDTLEGFLSEIRSQPRWRQEADKAADYYDDNQLTPEKLAALDERGLGPLTTNLIKPTINAVLGMEAKTRTDCTVGADDDRYSEVADALKSKLHEATRETRADRAISDAYASQIKAGLGIVEVSRDANPFNYPYRVRNIHRREIWWDWHSVEPDWSDARWLLRKRWFDADHLATYFPQHTDLIRHAGRGWHGFSDLITNDSQINVGLMHSHAQEARHSWDDLDWRDASRRRVACYEVWYRVWVRGLILQLPGGRVIEFDQKNPTHAGLVAAGVLQPKLATFDRLRVAFFVGPHRVQDIATGRRRFPYVPFWGYREDLTGVPYGLIRSMISPQDEVNARAQKMMWLMTGRRTVIEAGAADESVQTTMDVSREVGQANAFIVMKQGRMGSIKVDDNMQLSQQQFQIMQERKAAIQEVGGVYAAMMGQNSSSSSGLAIQSLVEQGTTTLAEINDNYRHGRRSVFNLLLDLQKEDLRGPAEIVVDTGVVKKRVQINVARTDPETGQRYRYNDVQVAPVQVALADVPSTPTFRAAQFAQLTEVTKSLPPQIQQLVVPFILEASEMPRRKELALLLREQLGIVTDPNSPEAQQAKQQQAQQAQQQAELLARDAESKIAEREARAQKANAEAQRTLAEIQRLVQAGDVDGASRAADSLREQLSDREADRQNRVQIVAMQQEGETARTQMKIDAANGGSQVARVAQAIDEMNEADEATAATGVPTA